MTSLLDLVPPARNPRHIRPVRVVTSVYPSGGGLQPQALVDEVVRQCLRDLSGVPEGALAEMVYRLARARLSAMDEQAAVERLVVGARIAPSVPTDLDRVSPAAV